MEILPKALPSGLLWGVGIAFTTIIHAAAPSYGSAFLGAFSSICPGFHGARSLADLLVGGFAGGFLLAWFCNKFVVRGAGCPTLECDCRHRGWAETAEFSHNEASGPAVRTGPNAVLRMQGRVNL